MKTFDKQQFANMIFLLITKHQNNYFYDAFYDIAKLRQLEIDREPARFNIYCRRTGFDIEFIPETLDNKTVLDYRYQDNDIVINCEFKPAGLQCFNDDEYICQVIKSDYTI